MPALSPGYSQTILPTLYLARPGPKKWGQESESALTQLSFSLSFFFSFFFVGHTAADIAAVVAAAAEEAKEKGDLLRRKSRSFFSFSLSLSSLHKVAIWLVPQHPPRKSPPSSFPLVSSCKKRGWAGSPSTTRCRQRGKRLFWKCCKGEERAWTSFGQGRKECVN